MEDIYGELDNYDDVNAIQELRSENMELKVKLEEHATAMEKLQKDYDTLEIEFKKLENNYSSLLKTARAEIERKTQRISQLNMEKDMMVLSSLQNGKTVRRHFNKGLQILDKKNNEKPVKGKGNQKVKEDDVKLKAVDAKNERCETASSQHKEMDPKASTDNRSNLVNKVEYSKAESSSYRKSNVKENLTHQKTEHNDTPKAHAGSIKDRRKSMPAVSMPVEKFSSDEECEPNYPTKDTRTDLPSSNKFESRNLNKILPDRHSNKTSETSSLDDKSSNYYESTSRETYRSRTSRQYDTTSSCKSKDKDKYEVSLKYRKHYSPDRGHGRQPKEYRDDHHRQEHGRYHQREDRGRQLESPPSESFSRYQRRNQDRRSNHDHDKYRHRYDDKHVGKHKMLNDYDEPHTKRQKTALFGNPDAHYRQNQRYYNDKESMDIQSLPKFSPHEDDILRSSCQSPDYVHTDAAFANPVKEIMATAATPLEDPRVMSKRYVIKKENGKELLTTALGRNVDIKSVDKAVWNIKPVITPSALVRPPSQYSEELIKDIYVDIDNPVADLSLESGELRFESGDEYLENRNNNQKEIQNVIRDYDTSKQVTEQITKQTTNSENILNIKYKIPKFGHKNKNINSKMDVPIIDVGEYIPKIKNISEKLASEDNCSKKTLARPRQNDDHDNLLSSNISDNKHETQSDNRIILSNIAIVADDLELSDENSDNVYSHRQTETENIKKNCKMQSNIKKDKKTEPTSYIENNTGNTSSHNNESEKAIDTAAIKIFKVDEKTNESDSTKKQKSKKKKSKLKDVSSKDPVESTDAIHVTEKKNRSKKEKEPEAKENKNKFSDLFGDSGSLMTPEDLGIPSYLPISEDAQDAVDLKINQIIDATPPIDNTQIPDDIEAQNDSEIKYQEATSYDNHPEKVLQKLNTDDMEVTTNIKKKKSSKRKEDKTDSDEIPPNVIYENLNPETNSSEADVVKTVIISMGLQPQVTLENNSEAVVAKPIADVEVSTKQDIPNINPIPAIMEFKKHDTMKALATSTPQKEFTALQPVEADSKATDFICHSNVSKRNECRVNATRVVDQSDTNTLDTHDAPDVRIFVKRRRKVLKRPPMT